MTKRPDVAAIGVLPIVCEKVGIARLPKDAGKKDVERWQKDVQAAVSKQCNGHANGFDVVRAIMENKIVDLPQMTAALRAIGITHPIAHADATSSWY